MQKKRLSDSLHTWLWLDSRSSSIYGKVLGWLTPGGPCLLGSQVGGSRRGQRAFPHSPVTAQVQQGKRDMWSSLSFVAMDKIT